MIAMFPEYELLVSTRLTMRVDCIPCLDADECCCRNVDEGKRGNECHMSQSIV